jgi:hypothetical protein
VSVFLLDFLSPSFPALSFVLSGGVGDEVGLDDFSFSFSPYRSGEAVNLVDELFFFSPPAEAELSASALSLPALPPPPKIFDKANLSTLDLPFLCPFAEGEVIDFFPTDDVLLALEDVSLSFVASAVVSGAGAGVGVTLTLGAPCCAEEGREEEDLAGGCGGLVPEETERRADGDFEGWG